MPRFRVRIEEVVAYEHVVDAEDEDEAREIATELFGADEGFEEVGGDFEITRLKRLKDDENA